MSAGVWTAAGLSLGVATAAVLLAAAPGVAVGYLLARRRGPVSGRPVRAPWLWEAVVLVPLALPPVVVGYGLLVAFSGTLAFTPAAAVLASTAAAFPFVAGGARAAFESVEPEWEEAGLVFGGTRWSVLRAVTLPLAARGVLAGLALGWARALGEYGATAVVAGNIPGRTQTLPIALFSALQRPDGELAALHLTAVAVVLGLGAVAAYALLLRRLPR